MPEAVTSHDIYFHIRVLLGVVVGLGVTRILSGLARLVQHPGQKRLYAPHLLWTLVILTSIVHFWWWEFALIHRPAFRFQLFVFILFYAFQFFVLASLLFPDEMSEYGDYQDYFLSRRRWFFGLFATTFVTDLADTLIKGRARLADLGLEYEIKLAVCIGLCLIAAKTDNRRFHLFFPAFYLLYYLGWIGREYDILG